MAKGIHYEEPNRCCHIPGQIKSNPNGFHCTVNKPHPLLVWTTSCRPLSPVLTLCLLIINSDCSGKRSVPWSPRPFSATTFSHLFFLLPADGFFPGLHWNLAWVSGPQRAIPAGPLHHRNQLWDRVASRRILGTVPRRHLIRRWWKQGWAKGQANPQWDGSWSLCRTYRKLIAGWPFRVVSDRGNKAGLFATSCPLWGALKTKNKQPMLRKRRLLNWLR